MRSDQIFVRKEILELEQRIARARLCLQGQQLLVEQRPSAMGSEILEAMAHFLKVLESHRDLIIRLPLFPTAAQRSGES